MARSATLSTLQARARRLADVEGDPNITDAELTDLANRHLTEVYDLLVDAGPPEYFASSTTLTTASGTTAYNLPSDFRSLLAVYDQETSTRLRAIPAMPEGARARFQPPTAVRSIYVEYVPAPPTLTGNQTFDGVSGWEELISNLMARDIMVKREDDPSVVINTIDRLMARVSSTSRNRDRGAPKRVLDADDRACDGTPWGWGSGSRIAAYRLRAGTLELFEGLWGLP